MKLDDNLIEGITIMWKVAVDLLLFDSTILSLDDDHLRLTSKICTTLGLIRNYNPFKGHDPDYHDATSACINFLLSGWIEITR